MEYIREYAFWNKDNDIANLIFSKLKNLKSSDISSIVVRRPFDKYVFNIDGFKIGCRDTVGIFGITYEIESDGVILDIGHNKAKKIFKSVEKIFNSKEIEDKEFLKKDMRISLRKDRG